MFNVSEDFVKPLFFLLNFCVIFVVMSQLKSKAINYGMNSVRRVHYGMAALHFFCVCET